MKITEIDNNKGFSLIEIVTVIIVLGILVWYTFSFFDHAAKAYLVGSKQTKLFQEATYMMERITQELKDANTVYLYNDDSWIYFYKTNVSGQQDSSDVWVYYFKSGYYLYRWTDAGFLILSDKISIFTVSRSVSAYPCSSSNPDCMISINLTLEDSSVDLRTRPEILNGDPPKPLTVSINTSVAPKNFESGWGGRSYNGYYYDVVE